ncbi:cysteine protease [Treponema sp. R8-4-B8]
MRSNKRIVTLILAAALSACALFAQTFPKGAILDDDRYNSLPRKAVQLTRSYTVIPKAYSLKQYAPQPGDQGNYGTCVGWASAYAARTIAESVSLNRVDYFLVTNNVFSPIFVYKGFYSLKNINPTGQEGAAISDILEFMKIEGAVKRAEFEKTMAFNLITLSMFSSSRRYPIGGYVTLYASRRSETNNARTDMVKKSICEGKPVIIGMNCPDSFFKAKEVWRPSDNPAVNYGGHAMCVVGYDDTKYGGAFEILNSWGTIWGNNGYIWIPYQVFNDFVNQAYEVIENLSAYKDGAEYSGSVKVEVENSKLGMPVTFEGGYYRTTGSYVSGTKFRYLLENDKPAYVYAFAGDNSSNETTMIFPPEGYNISPALDYSENAIAIPGESLWIFLDQKTGTDYLVVLYSKEALDIDVITERFSKEKGSFHQRVAAAVGLNYIPAHNARYETNEMRFSAMSGNPKAVFGLLLAINHK